MTRFEYKTSKQDDNRSVKPLGLGNICARLKTSIFTHYRRGRNFTFRWPCIVINSLQLNQLDALISQIYFWNKTPHVSDSSSAHHQQFFTVYTANLYDTYHCCVYSEELLMMDRGTVRNMWSFIPKINLRN